VSLGHAAAMRHERRDEWRGRGEAVVSRSRPRAARRDLAARGTLSASFSHFSFRACHVARRRHDQRQKRACLSLRVKCYAAIEALSRSWRLVEPVVFKSRPLECAASRRSRRFAVSLSRMPFALSPRPPFRFRETAKLFKIRTISPPPAASKDARARFRKQTPFRSDVRQTSAPGWKMTRFALSFSPFLSLRELLFQYQVDVHAGGVAPKIEFIPPIAP